MVDPRPFRSRSGRPRGVRAALFLVWMFLPLWLAAAGPFTKHRSDVGGDTDTAFVARHEKPNRLLAAGLAITVGPFGGHRLYLGTRPKVPLLYGLTFGGFGVLVLVDLGHILFTKDLTAYVESDRVLMWAGRNDPVEPTPP